MSYIEDKETFKVIIAGSRGFTNYSLLKEKMNSILGEKIISYKIEIVSGTANGADKLGERYAKEMRFILRQFPANWNLYGKRAGYIRNTEMRNYADACVVFWDGKSRGTKHMIDLAREKNMPLRVIKY